MKKTEFVILHETTLQSWVRDSSSLACCFLIFAPGVYLGSPAMQWVAFVLFILVIFARSSKNVHRMSLEEGAAFIEGKLKERDKPVEYEP